MKKIAPTAVAVALALFALSGRHAGAAIVGVPAVTTVSPGGPAVAVPVTLTTGGSETVTFTTFTINITFDPTKFAIDATNIALNPALAAVGFSGSGAIVGGNDFRVTFSTGNSFTETPNSVLNLFNFNLTALAGTAPGDYANGLLIANPGPGNNQTSVSDTSDAQFVTGTSSGLIRVTAVPEPSQVAFLALLGGLGAFKGVSVLNRRRQASV